ncbi:MAG: hypothetical protein CL678_10475 [Bdellovibrionaceae bacterium]|nr:hypothetical protein [Pseudobdellovibrionaceae bacterium]|tara:strand:+ start:659 stop:2527 length:1869 start_codon:yes stop_codon:yes gene_type:complete
MFFFFLLTPFLFGAKCHRNEEQVASEVISAFRGGCPQAREWTQRALNQSSAFIGVLESLAQKNQQACAGYVGLLQKISQTSQEFQMLMEDTDFLELRKAEEHVRQLQLAYDEAGTPDEQLAIVSSLANQEIELALIRSRLESRGVRLLSKTRAFNETLKSMLGQMNGLSSCLNASPGASALLATQLVAIGGNFIGPVVGTVTEVVGQLIGSTLEFVRHNRVRRAIWDAYATQIPLALTCATTAMTELYCHADDSMQLLKHQIKQYQKPGAKAHPVWIGIDLLQRRLPVLMNWLQSIKNGVPPNDRYEGGRQRAAWDPVYDLDLIGFQIEGGLREAKRRYDLAAGDSGLQKDILRNVLKDLAGSLSSGTMLGVFSLNSASGSFEVTPFSTFSGSRFSYLCWLVIGIGEGQDISMCPKFDGLSSPDQYLNNELLEKNPGFSFTQLQTNWESILVQVSKNVENQFSANVSTDPESIMNNSMLRTPDDISPFEVLIQIREMLDVMKGRTQFDNLHRKALIEDTYLVVNRAISIIELPMAIKQESLENVEPVCEFLKVDNQAKINSKKLVQCLFHHFQLGSRGVRFLSERINTVVETFMMESLESGELNPPVDHSSSVQDILMASGI